MTARTACYLADVARARRFLRLLVLVTTVATLVLAATPARAQLHWDAAAEAGAIKRFLGKRPPGGNGDAGFGPVVELHGHVALLPLLRVGAYVGHDISPQPGDTRALEITSFGVRAKVSSPVPLDPWRVWAFFGFGYAGAYGPSFHTTIAPSQNTHVQALATGAGGGFFEVPFGIGASYKLRKPWHLTAELAGRASFAYSGSLFDVDNGRAGFAEGQPPLVLSNPGVPAFALSLMVGVLLDM